MVQNIENGLLLHLSITIEVCLMYFLLCCEALLVLFLRLRVLDFRYMMALENSYWFITDIISSAYNIFFVLSKHSHNTFDSL